MASQNQPFPSLTLVPSAFAVANKSLSLSLPLAPSLPLVLAEILLSEGCFSYDALFARRLGNGLSIFCLVNGSFETTMLSLADTMLSSFDVYTIWLYYPLPSLVTGMCGLPGHSQIFTENSDN